MVQTASTTPLTVPPEVQTFAAEQGVASYLPAVLEMTQRVFPDARRMAVLLENDPEIPDDWHIVIEVDVANITAEQYLEAKLAWGRELFRICPAPLVCVFRLGLDIIEP
jgi:hypothetical protein